MKIRTHIGLSGLITDPGARSACQPQNATWKRLGAVAGLASLLLVNLIPPALSADQDAGARLVASAVNEKLAKLELKPRTAESIREKAQHARNAIKRSDFTTAHRITREVLAASVLQNWRYYPFQDFIASVPDVYIRGLNAI